MTAKILLNHLLKVLPKEDTKKSNSRESGFTLIEVLVTILVVTGFILGSLQAVVLATLFRVQAQDKNEAMNWVQQDLELIRYQAFILGEDENSCGSYGDTLENFIATSHPETDDINLGLPDNRRAYEVRREYDPDGNTLRITHIVAKGLADDSSNNNPPHPRYNSDDSYSYSDMAEPSFIGNPPPTPPNLNLVTTLSTEVIPDAALSCN